MTAHRLQHLEALPRAERRTALEAVVLEEFRRVLLMTEDDPLPLDSNFFDLGLSSLGVTTIRQRLEQELGCAINASVLFDSPTIERLLAHLTEEALPELFGRPQPKPTPTADTATKRRVAQLLSGLYGEPRDEASPQHHQQEG